MENLNLGGNAESLRPMYVGEDSFFISLFLREGKELHLKVRDMPHPWRDIYLRQVICTQRCVICSRCERGKCPFPSREGGLRSKTDEVAIRLC